MTGARPPNDALTDVRALFPGASHQVYLDVAVRGLLARPVREVVDRYLDMRMMGTGQKDDLRAFAERARASFARFIGAEPGDVALVKNVSEGLNMFASSLPWQAGDNVVVCQDLEHPANAILWHNLRRLRGIEVRTVPQDEGRLPSERMAAAIDGRTRVVTVPHVSFAPGFITDLAPITRAARAHGALVLVDAAQSVGALAIDVATLGADALAVATQKCLLAFYGFGFLWVRPGVAAGLSPVHAARYGLDLGAGAHETALGTEDLRFHAGARRFDLGNFNYLGAAAAEASLALLHAIGPPAIEAHLRGLAARLADGLLALGLPVAGGPGGPHLGHIVSVGQAGGGRHDTADDPAMNRLYERLTAGGVRLSIRRGVLRMSLGIYNDDSDVERVLALLS
jgi:selenocysteine lyase/cysteine desulfurase